MILMDIILEIFNYILIAILIGVSGAWIFLIKSMLDSFRLTPFVDKFEKKEHSKPKVSIILPARNEEKLIGRCIDSLLDQDYENYEIIAIDDSSEDSTGKIIKNYSPEKIILFGSFAYGKPSKDSDVDLCVLKKINKPAFKEKSKIWKLLWDKGFDFELEPDLHLYDSSQFKKGLKSGDFFFKEINNGKILYERQRTAKIS